MVCHGLRVARSIIPGAFSTSCRERTRLHIIGKPFSSVQALMEAHKKTRNRQNVVSRRKDCMW